MSFFFPILCTEAINGHVSQKALSMCIVSSIANICLLKTNLNRTIFARTQNSELRTVYLGQYNQETRH